MIDDDLRQLGRYLETDAQGRIILTMEVSHQTALDMAATGRIILPGTGDANMQYVANGELISRPENPTHVQDNVILDIPIPSYVWVLGDRYEALDGTFELDTDEIGPHRVEIQSFPYKDTAVYLESN